MLKSLSLSFLFDGAGDWGGAAWDPFFPFVSAPWGADVVGPDYYSH